MDNNWLEISVSTTTIVSELLSEFLEEEGSKGVVLGEWKPDEKSEYTLLRSFFPEEYTDVESLIQKINDKLNFYSKSGLETGACEISTRIVKEEDWANSWKKYFHTLHIGKNLVIKPLWEEYEKKENDLIIHIDPGMAFGTGTHATTQLCMEEIELLSEKIEDKENYTTLDLGTGSGILAITLNLLGFKNIKAVDNDIVAVKSSKENLIQNNLKIEVEHGELKLYNEKFDLIVGNLLAEIIESISDELYEKTNDNGLFIGSGIINHKEQDVIDRLTKSGFKLETQKYKDNWVLLTFRK